MLLRVLIVVVLGLVLAVPACASSSATAVDSGEPGDTALPSAVAQSLQACNVVWDSPSADARGSMPIGNGDIGLNVWVEPSGDLLFFVGKTDAWDENMRLLKLGKVRVKLTPALVRPGQPFTQTLDLARGQIIINSADAQVCVWVDANHPVIQVDARATGGQPLTATASFELWRKDKRPITGGEYHSTGFTSLPAFSWPDTVLPAGPDRVGWYHRNAQSPWLASLKLQKLEAIAASEPDPILNRTFGAVLRGDNFVPVSPTELRTSRPASALSLRVHVLTRVTETPEEWIRQIDQQARGVDALPTQQRQRAHAAWWSAFWNRSWIFVNGGPEVQTLTRGYNLQRFINACAGRGAYPIKFNGSIFVVDNKHDADFRQWGGGYWFQNTRLIYWSMLSAGDFDLVRPFFDMYIKALPARRLATKTYYGHDGAFFPETMSFWGNYLDQADLGYGVDRAGKPDGLTDNEYIRRYWQGGLELVAMMLDYHDLTQDQTFRDQTLLPLAEQVVTFFDQHWKRGDDGKIRFHPAQSLETWWNSTNPTPEIAGLRYVIPRLLPLTNDAAIQAAWRRTLADLPPVPLRNEPETGRSFIVPAEKFARKRNSENPELYAVFPFRLHTLASDAAALEIGRNTWPRRRHRENGGWQQNAIQAALLGLRDEAGRYVVDSASRHDSAFRFPAMWGPNYDWTPDQDHGSVMVIALQRMLVQYEGDKILVLPAWPAGWDCDFKLNAPRQTTIEGQVRQGKLTSLKVSPESRRRDVVIGTDTAE